MKCPKCGNTMSCGCQKRISPDGKVGCTSCVSSVQPKTTVTQSTAPKVTGAFWTKSK